MNNIFNHIHAMGARGSSPYRFYSKTPNIEKANDEGYRREKMDKAQSICRKFDDIKSKHMLKLNNAVLDVLNSDLPNGSKFNIKKYKEYPLASPDLFGRSTIFKDFKKSNKELLNRYNEVFNKICEIDKAKQNILKAETKEKIPSIENEFTTNFDASDYFDHPHGLNGEVRVTQLVKDMSNEIGQKFKVIPNVVNLLSITA